MIVVTLFARSLNSSSMFWSTLTLQWEGIRVGGTTFRHCPELLFSRAYRFKESTTYTSHTSRAVASNRPTEALASVTSLVFFFCCCYSHHKHRLQIPTKRTQSWTDCLSYKFCMDIASVVSLFRLRPWEGELCYRFQLFWKIMCKCSIEWLVEGALFLSVTSEW